MKHVKLFFYAALSLIMLQCIFGCAVGRGLLEGGLAFMEKPSVELVLDRLNTAACASKMAKSVLNDIPISDKSEWPKQMESFPKDQLTEIMRVLAIDGAYQAHGGYVSPIKGHVVQVQSILYDVPPDLYSRAGACYEEGEETFINGYYYKINGGGNFVKKSIPSSDELASALKISVKKIFEFRQKKCPHTTFLKRQGKYKSELFNKNITEGGYKNITEALISVIENQNISDIGVIKNTFVEINDIKDRIETINAELVDLENKKVRLKDNETVEGYKNISEIDNVLSIKKEKLDKNKNRSKELVNILFTAFDNIKKNLPIVVGKDLEILKRISEACKAINGLLTDSFTLTTIAMAKTPRSVMGLRNELKQLNQFSASSIYVPLRLARLKTNAGNVLDNIKTVILVLTNERKIVKLIKSTSDEIIKVSSQIGKEDQAVIADTSTDTKAVDEKIIIADTSEEKPLPVKDIVQDDEPVEIVKDIEITETAPEILAIEKPSVEKSLEQHDVEPDVSSVEMSNEDEQEIPSVKKQEIPSVKKDVIAQKVEIDIPLEEPEKISTVSQTEEINLFLNHWAQSWSSMNVRSYLNCYADDFRPASGKNKKQWESLRKIRLQKKSIQIDMSDIDITVMNPSNAIVTFKQTYHSNNFSDSVLKQLKLKRSGENWKIKEEKQLQKF
ncbi:MAG: hypothetical protein HQK75_13275 [Candidatus Magnetomorum sp.]|nr:hypothetical protein [Candidatus Magnetomorum sp.]